MNVVEVAMGNEVEELLGEGLSPSAHFYSVWGRARVKQNQDVWEEERGVDVD